ncbi:hypothetical protein BST61_g553 [Cercospora zeina]
MTLRNIAIVGANGHLGKQVATALLSSLCRPSYGRMLFLTQDRGDDTTAAAPDGAEPRRFTNDKLPDALHGVDVLISTVGPSGHTFKDSLVDAIAKSDVKLYIPSEFGVDHTLHDFSQPEWDHKKHHDALVKAQLHNTKVCRIYAGLFLEDSLGPWFGMDVKRRKFHSVGSADVPVSFTTPADVGKTVAQIARMRYEDVPPQLHISGDALSIRQVARVLEHAGSPPIDVEEIQAGEFKSRAIADDTLDPMNYLRFLMGEGKINHTASVVGNDNELVNPGQRLWTWKTVSEYADDVQGQPWFDYDWPAEETD